MKSPLALVFYYPRMNRYGINAVAGALETLERFRELPVYFPEDRAALHGAIAEALQKHETVVVGFSFLTLQMWEYEKIIGGVRAKFGDQILCIAGGPHPTGDPEGTLRMGIDLVVVGEGEETLPEILDAVAADGTAGLACGAGFQPAPRTQRCLHHGDIPGTAYLNSEGQLQYAPRRAPVDLDKYPALSFRHCKYGPIEITRGCSHGCHFCQLPHLHGGRPRHRSLERILDIIHRTTERGLRDVRFVTPNAFSYGSPDGRALNLPALEGLLKGVREVAGPKRRISFGSFPSEVRPEHVWPETIELVKRYANNDNLVIGAQSGSDRMLEACHRGHTFGETLRAVELTLAMGLKANVDFIFGLPGETPADVEATIAGIRHLTSMGARIHTHTFMPLPQTPFAGRPAGEIAPKVRMLIEDLVGRGQVYGNWDEQEFTAKRIAKYLQAGKMG